MGRNSILGSFLWKFLERSSIQASYFIVTLVLARLVTPEEYGSIAIIMIFIAFATVLVQGGLNTALIREPKANKQDFSTMFWISLLIAIIMYFILFNLANTIAYYFGIPQLSSIIKVLALILIPGALKSIQVAYATRHYLFKKLFLSSLIASTISGVIAIVLALLDFGVWSLVALQLIDTFLNSTILLFLIDWKPHFVFKTDNIRSLINFGTKILASNFLTTFFMNMRSLIIGRVYSASQVAYFNKGKQFPQVVMETINGSIQSVLLPVFADKQGNRDELVVYVRRFTRASIYLIFPSLIGLTVVARPLVLTLLTDKWIESVFYLQVFALTYMTQPTQIINNQAIISLGNSGIILRLDMLRKFIEILLLIIALPFGVKAVAVSAFFASLLSMIITMKPINDLLHYSYSDQFLDFVYPFLISIAMGGITYIFGLQFTSNWMSLIIQIIIGITSYIIILSILKPKGFIELREIISYIICKNNRSNY